MKMDQNIQSDDIKDAEEVEKFIRFEEDVDRITSKSTDRKISRIQKKVKFQINRIK